MLQIDAPSTLLLGVWLAEGRAALTGSLVSDYGDTLPDVVQLAGEPWTVLVQALEQAALMDVRHVVILTNAAALVGSLSPPFAAPKPDRMERIDMAPFLWLKAEWRQAPVGGYAPHWRVLQLLGGQWGGRFKTIQVDDLPKTRELWQQSQ